MYDMHNHTLYSDDSNTLMANMIEAGIQQGLKGMAITDHYDPDYPTPEFQFTPDFPAYHKEMEQVKDTYKDKIEVLLGVEIGIQHGDTLEKCREVANGYTYDFILGSFHCAHGKDLYVDYFSDWSIEEAYHGFYQYMLDCLNQYQDFDVLAHFNIIDRYTSRVPSYRPYMEEIEAILRVLVDRNKGIEINTSSFRYNLGDLTTPSKDILMLYKQLGGEIITLGSDAHSPRHVGYKLDWAKEFAEACGFRYYSHFKNRKPLYEKLK
jgi:histidinol-phosphatase (PHP family)